ncbi:hypothetical protein K3495_g7704 [Podosphaera aphanis]|nr:hypothetical protein K3495_g7704 [Podosphaera aphanis]
MLRPRLPRGRPWLNRGGARRTYFHVPELSQFRGMNVVPHFLSETAFHVSWIHYQTFLLLNLNKSIIGTPWESRTLKEIFINHARDPLYAARFNFASMAHNNHFFFDSLANEMTNPEQMPTKMREQIIKSFGSIETMRLEILKTANAMFGPGFVWLVKDFENRYSVLATYLAGSPYPLAIHRKQPLDMNTSTAEDMATVSEHLQKKIAGPTVNSVGKFGQHSETEGRAPGSVALVPIICVNVWQHVYLPDYGVGVGAGGGKELYLKKWWDVIDWNKAGYRALGNGQGEDFIR